MELFRIVFSGSGGQGVITSAIILAEAAVLHEGLEAVQSQAYGPEARGGATRSDVIIADGPIYFPKVLQPGVLVCLTQEAYNKFAPILRPGGLLLSDTRHVTPRNTVDARQVALAMHQAVLDKLGQPIVFNICMLGAVVGLTGAVRLESVAKVLESRVPAHLFGVNREALEIGFELGQARAEG